MRRNCILSLLLVSIALALTGCAAKSLAASKAFSYACEVGGECAVYMTLTNAGREADNLLGARTDVAGHIELHKLRIDEQGGLVMQPMENVPLPASRSVELKPGSMHLMLVGLTRELKMGDTFSLTLLFGNAAEETVEVVVMPEN